MANSIRSLLRRESAAIMGVINTTPDSFSDGGQFLTTESALRHALKLVDEGADILDIGGESTRPGATQVSTQEELDRVIPVIEAIVDGCGAPISIDTCKPAVMLAAVEAGASMINDVNGLRQEGALGAVVKAQVPVCIMHMQGRPDSMQRSPEYVDVVAQVIDFLKQQVHRCTIRGISKGDLILDPGIGFGKTLHHNLRLLNSVGRMREQLGCELLIGVSRKSMIDTLFGRSIDERLPASLGLIVQSVLNGARIVRVHDVRATYDAVRAVEAVVQSS